MFHFVIITLIGLFLLTGCGYKGDPKYEASKDSFLSQVKIQSAKDFKREII
jgi:hypothetical protein